MASTAIVFDLIGRDRASAEFDRVGNSAERSGGKLRKLGQVGKLAGLGLAGGAATASVALFKMAKGAAEDEAGQKRLATALRNAAGATSGQVGAVEDWITAQGKALGVADDDLRPALQKLVGATKDVGKAQRLASLAMDVSAGSGKSLDAVSTALAKAQNGNVAALSRLGISTKDAAGKTISFEEAQKRLATLHKGQAAAGANTLEGKMGRLKLALSEAGESVGAKLIPVLTKLATWVVNEGLPKMEKFGAWLSATLPPIFEKVKAVVTRVMGALKGDVGGGMNSIKSTISSAVSIIKSLWSTFGGAITGYIKPAFTNAIMIMRGAFTVVQGIFKTVSALLKGDWKGVWEGIKGIVRGAVGIVTGIVRQLWNLIRAAFRIGVTAVLGIFRGLWSAASGLVRTGATGIANAIGGLPGRLVALGGKFLEAGKKLMGKIFEGFRAVGNIGADIGRNLFNGVRNGINAAIQGINNFLPNKIGLPGLPDIDLPDNPIPKIPALAKGGIVSRPTLALIGEAGPEAVVPLSGGNARRAGIGGGGVTVVVNVSGYVGNETQLASQVERALVQYQRSTGRPLAFKTA